MKNAHLFLKFTFQFVLVSFVFVFLAFWGVVLRKRESYLLGHCQLKVLYAIYLVSVYKSLNMW